jgi:hypothetical protein
MESSLSLDVRFINRFMVRNILEEIARGKYVFRDVRAERALRSYETLDDHTI